MGIQKQRPTPGWYNLYVDTVSRHNLDRLNASNDFKNTKTNICMHFSSGVCDPAETDERPVESPCRNWERFQWMPVTFFAPDMSVDGGHTCRFKPCCLCSCLVMQLKN